VKTSHFFLCFITGILCAMTWHCSADSLRQPSVNNLTGTIEINLRRAKAFFNSNLDSTRYYLVKAEALADSLDNMALMAEIDRQLGNTYWLEASYQNALEYYLRALPLYDTLGNYLGVSMIYNNLGEVHKKLNDFDKALEFHAKSLATKKAHLDIPPLMSYYNLGELYELQGNPDTARVFYQQLLDQADFDQDFRPVAYAYSGLGRVHDHDGQTATAVYFFKEALQLRKLANDQRGIASSFMNLARVYIKMGNDIPTAKAFADSSEALIDRIGAKDLEVDNYLLLAKIDSIRGDYLTAINYFQRHYFLKDSLYSLDKSYQINQLLTNYETEKTANENQTLIYERDLSASQIRMNRIIIILISVGLVLATLFTIRLKIVNTTVGQQREELVNKARDLELALQRLATRNEENKSFSYMVSHDLKAPIRVISYYTSILKSEWHQLNDEDIREHLQGIDGNLRKMQNIITDLLDFSRVSQADLKVGTVSLDELAHEVIEGFRVSEPDREVQVDIDKDLIVEADQAMMQILLKNLLENAWKYTRGRHEPYIKLQKFGQNTYTVADNGVGFDMDFYDKLFTPFKRLHGDSEFEGTGIGLSITKSIMDKHGGRIWAESQLNHGSKFFFSFRAS